MTFCTSLGECALLWGTTGVLYFRLFVTLSLLSERITLHQWGWWSSTGIYATVIGLGHNHIACLLKV